MCLRYGPTVTCSLTHVLTLCSSCYMFLNTCTYVLFLLLHVPQHMYLRYVPSLACFSTHALILCSSCSMFLNTCTYVMFLLFHVPEHIYLHYFSSCSMFLNTCTYVLFIMLHFPQHMYLHYVPRVPCSPTHVLTLGSSTHVLTSCSSCSMFPNTCTYVMFLLFQVPQHMYLRYVPQHMYLRHVPPVPCSPTHVLTLCSSCSMFSNTCTYVMLLLFHVPQHMYLRYVPPVWSSTLIRRQFYRQAPRPLHNLSPGVVCKSGTTYIQSVIKSVIHVQGKFNRAALSPKKKNPIKKRRKKIKFCSCILRQFHKLNELNMLFSKKVSMS
jgi:hypothetical protein